MNGQKLKAFMTDKDFLEEMTAKRLLLLLEMK